MSAGHTPGPWEWTWEDESMVSLHGPDIMVDHVLACTPCKACRKRGGKCLSPNDANARLIVAAPDMLEALEELEHAYGDFHGEPFAFPEDHPHTHARAAIAKATGSAD